MKLLSPKIMMDDLMHHNIINYWCKVYFTTKVMYDSVANNFFEFFNAWILAARNKTIITMLEDIRVKIITRITTLRQLTILRYLPSTWNCNYSPMSSNVLEESINKFINFIIEFNRVAGFEVKKEFCQHKIVIFRRTCSCRLWKLKGIQCAHIVAASL